MRVLATFIFYTILFSMFPASALSGLTIHDMVVPKGKEVMLRAETKGGLFSRGGEVVEFFVDGKSIGRSLSGGDGFAFRQFTPLKTGLHRITVRSDRGEGEGSLFALRKGSRIVFVDVGGSLLERFSIKPRHGSQKAIEEIRRRFPVVFLQTGFLSKRTIEAWLKKNEFMELPLVSWRGGAIFDEMGEKGFRIRAIIGSPGVIKSAEEYKPMAFSFEEAEGVVKVKDWEEIIRKLK